jgi:hypothetical protein
VRKSGRRRGQTVREGHGERVSGEPTGGLLQSVTIAVYMWKAQLAIDWLWIGSAGVARHSPWTRGDTPFGQDRNRNSLARGDSSVNILVPDLPGEQQLSSKAWPSRMVSARRVSISCDSRSPADYALPVAGWQDHLRAPG